MNDNTVYSRLADLYRLLQYVPDEWADFTEDQLEDASRHNRTAAEILSQMKRTLSALYEDRFGPVPPLSEQELVQGIGLAEARQYIINERKAPFVLDPPQGFFAKKPKKEDYYACGRAIEMVQYYSNVTAVRQEAYRKLRFEELPALISEYDRILTEATENSPVDQHAYQKYTRGDARSKKLYIGDVLQHVYVPEETSEGVQRVLDKALEDAGILQGRMLRVPCTYRADQPFCLFVNHTYSLDHPEEAALSVNLAHDLIYQVIRTMPPYSYQFTYMDPLRAGQSLGALQGLGFIRDGNAFWLKSSLYNNLYILFDLVTNTEGMRQRLEELTNRIGKINGIKGAMSSITDYNAGMFLPDGSWKENAEIVPQQFIIIENTHGVLGSDTCQKLETLIDNAKSCGISVIMISSRPRTERIDEYENRLIRKHNVDVVDWAPEGASLSTVVPQIGEEEGGTYRYGFRAFSEQCSYPGYVQSLAEELKPNLNVNTVFTDLFDLDSVWGSGDATDGIRVPIGVNDRRQITEIMIGGSEINGLLAGTIGCGKSSFLHTIINSILMYYRPEDVELWLSDYKAVEFVRYMTNTPANITYIGTARTKEYSLAFIDKIYDEYERRAALFGKINATSVREYREHFGKDSMPRLEVIIDEFHVMSNHIKDEPEYSQKLGSILREARFVGVGLLLSDQTCGVGLQGLKEDARKQLNLRMAMRTTTDEYNAVFNISNSAEVVPKTLNYEVVVKRESKRVDENGIERTDVRYEHCKTIFTPPEQREQIARKSIETYGTNEEADVITKNLRHEADWRAILEESAARPLRKGFALYPGIPTDLKSMLRIQMSDGYSENLMSIGSDDILQTELLIHLAESIRYGISRSKIYFLAMDNDDIFMTAENWIEDFCRDNDDAQLLTDEEEICRCIAKQYSVMEGRRKLKAPDSRIFLFWLGMPDLCRDMSHYPEEKPAALRGDVPPAAAARPAPARTIEDSRRELDDMFSRLFGEAPAVEEPAPAVTMPEDEEGEEEFLYNASQDITALLDEGARRGIHSLVFNSSVPVSKKNRCAKFEYFNHRIAFRMSKDDAMEYLGSSRLILTPDNEIIDEETGVYFDGKKGVHFVPFINNEIEDRD